MEYCVLVNSPRTRLSKRVVQAFGLGLRHWPPDSSSSCKIRRLAMLNIIKCWRARTSLLPSCIDYAILKRSPHLLLRTFLRDCFIGETVPDTKSVKIRVVEEQKCQSKRLPQDLQVKQHPSNHIRCIPIRILKQVFIDN